MIETISINSLKKRDFFAKNKFKNINQINSTRVYGYHMETVKYTVVVPTYKRIDDLKKCLLSLLNQKTKHLFQIIVVNNCQEKSINHSVLQMITSLGDKRIVYYLNEKNLDAMGNWNRCFLLAQSEWVAMVHDDDIVNENWIDTMIQYCMTYDDYDCIACEYKTLISEDEKNLFVKQYSTVQSIINVMPNMMLRSFKAPLLGAFIKRECFLELGGFELKSTNFEDYIFMTKLSYYGKIMLVKSPLYGYAVNDGNDSNSSGLWDDILIGQYYMRKQTINKISNNKLLANLCNVYDLISCVEKHNENNGNITGFKNTSVDKKYVYKSCNLNPLLSHILGLIIRMRLKYFLRAYL